MKPKSLAKKIGCDWIGGVKVEAIPSYEKMIVITMYGYKRPYTVERKLLDIIF